MRFFGSLHGVAVFVAAGVIGGCTNAPPAHSCAGPTGCVDFIATPTTIDERSLCDGWSGSYSTSAPCPASGRVGRCTMTFGVGTLNWTYQANYYAPQTTLAARNECPPPMPSEGTLYEFQEN